MNVLGSVAIVRSTDHGAALQRYEALLGVPPLHEFPIVDRELSVAVFPGLSVLSGEPSALALLGVYGRRSLSVPSARPRWNCDRPGGPRRALFGRGGQLLARDPDGNLIEFVENPGDGQ